MSNRRQNRELERVADLVRKLLGAKVPATEVDDATGEVMLGVVDAIDRCPVENIEALAVTIAKRRIADAARRRDKAPKTVELEHCTVTEEPTEASNLRAAVVAAHELSLLIRRRWTEEDSAHVMKIANMSKESGPVGPTEVEPGIWLIPKATRRSTGHDWRSVTLALNALGIGRLDRPGLGRPMTAKEIALAAIASGWVRLTEAEARKALGGRRRWQKQIDVVDDVLERSGATALRRARGAHPPTAPNVVSLPVIAPQHRRKGRANPKKRS